MKTSSTRSVAYGGLLFVAVVVVAVVIASPPSTNATAAKVMTYYHAHQAVSYANAYLITLAVVVGIPYFWFLRDFLAQTASEGRKLLTVGFAGAVLFAVSGLLGAGMKFALADGSHAGNIPSATLQALNLLQQDFNTPANAAGTALFLIPTGLAIVRAGGLPRWLGWVGLVFGVISATGFAGPVGVGLWILAASVTMLAKGDAPSAAAAATQTEGA